MIAKKIAKYYRKFFINLPIHLLFLKIIWKILKRIKDRFYFLHFNKINLLPKGDLLFIKQSLNSNISVNLKELDTCRKLLVREVIDDKLLNNLSCMADKDFILNHIKDGQLIKEQAEKYCMHRFDLLGSGDVNVSYHTKAQGLEGKLYNMGLEESQVTVIKEKIDERIKQLYPDDDNDLDTLDYQPIDWQLDFKSGFRWNHNQWYKDIKFGHKQGADIKVPWELSRCYHFVTLGQAYLLTEDKKYAREFIYQTIDWIENNPLQYGVNWACTMDVAIRACNWILGFAYFNGCDLLNYKFKFEFAKNIYFHGIHILRNLEKYPFGPSTNHYLSNLTGLIYIGLFLNKTSFGKKCLSMAVRELKKEIKQQVYPDGCNFEASTYYHRLVLELSLYPVIYLTKSHKNFNGDNFTQTGVQIFGKNYLDKLYCMLDVLKDCIKKDGTIPQVGDNDSGRLHIFASTDELDVNYILAAGAVYFNHSGFQAGEKNYNDEAFWIFGSKCKEYLSKKKNEEVGENKSKSLPDSGWYIMKNDYCYMMISAGPNGQNGFGGHAHNDKLSFELNIQGNDIIVDPGSYLYTPFPQWRNKFRSTGYHNTIVIDSIEQNKFTDRSVFLLEDITKVKINRWQQEEEFDFFDGEHYGYLRLDSPVVHRRQIYNNKKDCFFIIKDIFRGKSQYSFEAFFHLKDDLEYDIKDGYKGLVFNINGSKNYKLWSLKPKDIDFGIEDGYVSSGYGVKKKSKIIKYSKRADAPCEFIFIIANEDSDFSVEKIEKYFGKLDV